MKTPGRPQIPLVQQSLTPRPAPVDAAAHGGLSTFKRTRAAEPVAVPAEPPRASPAPRPTAHQAAAQVHAALLMAAQIANGSVSPSAPPMDPPPPNDQGQPGPSSAVVRHQPPVDQLPDMGEQTPMRLPSAWYAKPPEKPRGLSPERHAQMIRGAAAACIVTAAGLMVWLGTMPGTMPTETPSGVSSFAPEDGRSTAAITPADTPVEVSVELTEPIALAVRPPPTETRRGLVTTAQILAVAERLIATGDILAARAMLNESATAGEPRALFALAETYDPNLLASWNARNVEANPSYARLLYDAARRGGLAEAQTRLDVLK